MKAPATFVLTGRDVKELLSLDKCIDAVEAAFRLHGEGKADAPGVLGVHVEKGGFHIKAGVLKLARNYFAAKVNGNFPANGCYFGLPTIQGVIILADGENGCPLAVMDSVEITALRTAAATAVAAKHLARKDSRVVMVCGCGVQGGYQLRALACVLRLERAFVFDLEEGKAERLARELGGDLGIEVRVASDLQSACRESDVCVTCTTSHQFFLSREHVRPGTFIAAVGADNPEKEEIDPALMAASKIVVDVAAQCAAIGDLRHALESGLVAMEDVHAELGEVVAGRKSGRTSEEELVLFDSTGIALQDVAAAAVVYEKAAASGSGFRVEMADSKT